MSTNGKDDTDVEEKETIIITMGTLVNATTDVTDVVTLNLISDDNPTVTSISADKDLIAEHESAILTATIDKKHSKDIFIEYQTSGTVEFELDYSIEYESNQMKIIDEDEYDINTNQFTYRNIGRAKGGGGHDLEVDVDGSVYTIGWDQYPYENELYKLEKGAANATVVQTVTGRSNDIFIDENKNIYMVDTYEHRVKKYAAGSTTGTIVAGGNGQGNNANQLNYPRGVFVDSSGNIYVADTNNHRVQKWALMLQLVQQLPNGTTDICNNLSQLYNPLKVYVDDEKSFVCIR